MKLNYLVIMITSLALPHFVFSEEDDKPVKFADLPASVAKVIKEAAGKAELKDIKLGDEDGTPAYEATWVTNGHNHEIAVSKDGAVLSLEEIITLAEAPEPVRAAMTKAAGDSKVLEVEKVIGKGKTHYEMTIAKSKGKLMISFDENGKELERENSDVEKNEKAEGGKEDKKK